MGGDTPDPGQPGWHDPLLAGFIPTADAARLIGERATRLRGWMNGWPRSGAGPILARDFDGDTVSFLDLMELRFVRHFRLHGVSMQTLRRGVARLRDEWQVRHPLALKNSVHYLTDRRRIFAQASKVEGDHATWDLATNQVEMWTAIETTIAGGVRFDPVSSVALRWHPRPLEFPNVIVDPRLAFGYPVIGEFPATPTATLHRQWVAEGGDFLRVADWYDVTDQDVRDAVHFEMALAA